MKCLCLKKLPCPIHKDNPLPMPVIVEHHCFVARVYQRTSNGKWYVTLSKDAIQVFVSDDMDTKAEAVERLFK